MPEQSKYAHPQLVLRGVSVTVTLRSTVLCAGRDTPLHIVLVMGTADPQPAGETGGLQAPATSLIQGLDLEHNPQIEVGLVEYTRDARTLSELTNSQDQLEGAIAGLTGGGTALAAGVEEADRAAPTWRLAHQRRGRRSVHRLVGPDRHVHLRSADSANARAGHTRNPNADARPNTIYRANCHSGG